MLFRSVAALNLKFHGRRGDKEGEVEIIVFLAVAVRIVEINYLDLSPRLSLSHFLPLLPRLVPVGPPMLQIRASR